MRTCYDKHPTWKHMVWTNQNLPVPFIFKKEWKLDNNNARRSDLLRLQILFNHGGVYLDTDMECIKPIDNLLSGYNFVMATECSHVGKNEKFSGPCDQKHINNAVIASTKENPTVYELMMKMKENYRNDEIDTSGKPTTYVAKLSGPTVYNKNKKLIYANRGAKLYTNEYFYPVHYSNRKKMEDWQIPTNPKFLSENTHMIHHFAASWYKQK